MRGKRIILPATATLLVGLYLGNQGHAAIQNFTDKIQGQIKSALGIHEILTQELNQKFGIIVEEKDEIKFNESDIKVISESIIAESYVYDTAENKYIVPLVKNTPFEFIGTESLSADCLFLVKVGYNDDPSYFKILKIDDKNNEITIPRPQLIISSVDPVSKDKLKSNWDLFPFRGYTENDISNMFFYKSKELKEEKLPKYNFLHMFQDLANDDYKKKAKNFSFMQGKYRDYEIKLENENSSNAPLQEILDLREKLLN